jgi:shikimate kinase
MPNIFLVGFMGTGKSSVGRRLAKEMGLRYIDTDELIEAEAKMPISEIFGLKGEDHFRELEEEVLSKVARLQGCIVATGGGIVLRERNMETMRRSGIVVCLSASPEVIYSRVKNGSNRPLLAGGNAMSRIKEMLAYRKPYYEKADYIIDTSGLSVGQVASEVSRIVKSQRRRFEEDKG